MTLLINSILAFAAIGALFLLLWQTILLRKQMKVANDLARNQAYQFRYQLYLEMDKLVVANPKFKKLISNGCFLQNSSEEQISDEESEELAFIELVMNLAQLSYMQHEDGLIDSELGWVKGLVKNRYIVKYWNSGYKCDFRENFVRFINSELDKNGEME